VTCTILVLDKSNLENFSSVHFADIDWVVHISLVRISSRYQDIRQTHSGTVTFTWLF